MSKPRNIPLSAMFQSCLASWFQRFIQEKRALGFCYTSRSLLLRQLDRLLQDKGITREELPKTIVEQWLTPQRYNSPKTIALRRTIVRQVSLFLIQNNIPAYVPPYTEGKIVRTDYAPWIFTRNEFKKLLGATDSLPFTRRAPLRHLIIPEVFRLLYGCGLRISEVVHLQVKDVDLAEGILTITKAKGNKDRLVPLAYSLQYRLNRYAEALGDRSPETPFFPAPDGGPYNGMSIYNYFRILLEKIGISHGGRGRGPRLHDLRHTFAVHCLIRWYREGANINAKLPVLSAYLGHKYLEGTQRYLHLTAEIFPDINLSLESYLGQVIPRRKTP